MNRQIASAIPFIVGVIIAGSAWPAMVSVGDGPVRPGGTVDIAVAVDGGIDLGGVNLRLEYDPVVFPSANVSPGPLLDPSHVVKSHSPAAGKFNVAAYAPPGAPSLAGQSGTVFTISLQVSPSAATGEYPITFSASGATMLASSGVSDMSGTSIAHAAEPGSVTVFEALVTDLNTDGEITGADLMIIIRDWHKWHYYIDPMPADINQDEWVNEKDLMIFMKDWRNEPQLAP
jgi:hypothetical protein